MHWQEALEQSDTALIFNQADQAAIWAPDYSHQDYILAAGAAYHAATVEGCERLLEELAVSKVGWQ